MEALCTVREPDWSPETILNHVCGLQQVDVLQGESIGGMEILQDSHAIPEKAVCSTACEILVLSQPIHKTILHQHKSMEIAMRIQHLKNYPCFYGLSDAKLEKLEKAMVLREVPSDTVRMNTLICSRLSMQRQEVMLIREMNQC